MNPIRGMLRLTLWHRDDSIATLDAFCPACDFEHSFRVDLDGHGHWTTQGTWEFNGDYDKPTFSPSMGANLHGIQEHHPRCHSFLRDGVWQYLNDCTHEMAGQHVPMVMPDPDMSFERRHGWHLFPWCDSEGKPIKDA